LLAVTPAEVLGARGYSPFCAVSVLGTIHALADASHSKAMSDLVTEGKWKGELLFSLGKVGPPRYANFIGRYRDDPDAEVRAGVAAGLGLIDNEPVTVPVLVTMLAKNDDAFHVKWEAAHSLILIAKRKTPDGVRRRVIELFKEPNAMTATLAARVLASTGDTRGVDKLRELTVHADRSVRAEAVLALGELADAGSREAVTRRLTDDAVSVRAAAIYALARTAGAPALPALRKATEDALAYERRLDAQATPGPAQDAARTTYGIGEFDLRETLQEAIGLAQKPRGR
jgi:HEAT repeat protein